MKTYAFIIILIILVFTIVICNVLWSRQKLISNASEITQVAISKDPKVWKSFSSRSGIHMMVYPFNYEHQLDDVCALERPILFPFGWWVIKLNGSICWLSKSEQEKMKILD